MSETDGAMQTAPRELEALLASGDVTGALLLSPALQQTITPRELDLIRQAFEAGVRIGRSTAASAVTISAPPSPAGETAD